MEDNENKEIDKLYDKKAISRSTIHAIFPPESLKSLLATSDAILRVAKQNDEIFRRFSTVVEAQAKLVDLSHIPRLPVAFEEASSVSKSIERLLSLETPRISKMFDAITNQSDVWKEQQLAMTRIAKAIQENDAIWQSHFLEISKFAALSQTSLARIQWEKIGSALELHTNMQNNLRKSFQNFSNAYAKLFDSLENQPKAVLLFPPTVTKLPVIEFYNGVSVVDSITFSQEPDIEFEKENEILIDETRKETDDRLVYLLEEVNGELIIPLKGARLCLTSANPDRVRHFATSLRELFTHVLHTLAPDNDIRSWSNLPEHYNNGVPTRRARLLYVCRALNQDEFFDFVEKDVAAVLAFLKLFQKGTHQVVPQYSELQLKLMLLRMESAIRFLLEIWRAGN